MTAKSRWYRRIVAKRKPATTTRKKPTPRSVVFVEREVEVALPGAKSTSISLTVYKPTEEERGSACGYEIKLGKKIVRARRVFGTDAMASLIAALGVVDIELEFVLRTLPGAAVDEAVRTDLRRLRPVAAARKA